MGYRVPCLVVVGSKEVSMLCAVSVQLVQCHTCICNVAAESSYLCSVLQPTKIGWMQMQPLDQAKQACKWSRHGVMHVQPRQSCGETLPSTLLCDSRTELVVAASDTVHEVM